MDKIILIIFAGVAVFAFVMLVCTVDAFLFGNYAKALRAWLSCACLSSGAVLLALYLRKKG